MDRRLYLLREIHENSRVSQRQLAKHIGLSLGTINALMQQLEADEWIESKTISGKSTEYTITKLGHHHKAELSKVEAVHCYQFIGEIKNIIHQNLEGWIKDGFSKFALIGEEDEIFKVIKLTIKALSRFKEIDYEVYENYEDVDSISNHIKYIAWDDAHIKHEDVAHILEFRQKK